MPINFYKAGDKEIREIRKGEGGHDKRCSKKEKEREGERERGSCIEQHAPRDTLSRFRIVRYYRMRAPTTLPPVPRSTMRQPTCEYCDFLRNLKSRGCYRFDDQPRYIYIYISSDLCRPLSRTTSHGHHSRQIETGLCIRLTRCVATSSRSLDSPSCRVYVPSLLHLFRPSRVTT